MPQAPLSGILCVLQARPPTSAEQADEEGPQDEDPDDAELMHSLGLDDEAVTGGPQVTLAAQIALLGTELMVP